MKLVKYKNGALKKFIKPARYFSVEEVFLLGEDFIIVFNDNDEDSCYRCASQSYQVDGEDLEKPNLKTYGGGRYVLTENKEVLRGLYCEEHGRLKDLVVKNKAELKGKELSRLAKKSLVCIECE